MDEMDEMEMEMEETEGMEEEEMKKKAMDARHFINLFNWITLDNIYEFTLNKNYEFTYIGHNCAKQDDSILLLSNLLPRGFCRMGLMKMHLVLNVLMEQERKSSLKTLLF